MTDESCLAVLAQHSPRLPYAITELLAFGISPEKLTESLAAKLEADNPRPPSQEVIARAVRLLASQVQAQKEGCTPA